MRFFIAVFILELIFAKVYQLKAYEFAILCLAFGLVILAQIINTAVKTLAEKDFKQFKDFKDISAGGVFISALVWAAASCFVLGIFTNPLMALGLILMNFTRPDYFIVFILLIALAFAFVFLLGEKKKPESNEKHKKGNK